MTLALILVALANPAAALVPAARPASCLHVSSGTAPTTLDGLRACQSKTRAAVVASAASKGAPLTDAQLDQIDDYQRAEARKFLAKTSAKNKLGGATAADLGRLDSTSATSIQDLQGRLQAEAGDGKDGITPSMADDIRATLIKAQGGMSPEMKDLLDSVQRDGGKLTPETMTKLQNAGKAAKAEGLDLNIDPAIEKQLLGTDFSKDQPSASPPGGM